MPRVHKDIRRKGSKAQEEHASDTFSEDNNPRPGNTLNRKSKVDSVVAKKSDVDILDQDKDSEIGLNEAIELFAASLSRIGDQLLCPICRSLYKCAARLPCGHAFCRECINTCVGYQPKCPECRAPATRRNVSDYECMQRIVRNFQKLHYSGSTSGNAGANFSPSMLTQPETASQLVAAFRGGLDEYLVDKSSSEDAAEDMLDRLITNDNEPLVSPHASQTNSEINDTDVGSSGCKNTIQSPNVVEEVLDLNDEEIVVANTDDPNSSDKMTIGNASLSKPDFLSIPAAEDNSSTTVGLPPTEEEVNQEELNEKLPEEFDGPLHVGDCIVIRPDWSPGNTLDGGQGIIMDIENDELFVVRLILSKRTQKVTRHRIAEKIEDINSRRRPRRKRKPPTVYEPELYGLKDVVYHMAYQDGSSKRKAARAKKKKCTTQNATFERSFPRHFSKEDARNQEGDSSSNTNERISEVKKLLVSKKKKKKSKKRRRLSVTFALPSDRTEEEEANADQLSQGDTEKAGSSSSVFKQTDIESSANASTSIYKPKKLRSTLKRKKKRNGSHDISSSKENAMPSLKCTTPRKCSTSNDVVLMFVGSGVKHLIEIGREACRALGGRVNMTLSQCDAYRPTHIVVKSNRKPDDNCDLMNLNKKINLSKLYHGILIGAWVVDEKWLFACKDEMKWVDEAKFEIQGDATNPSCISGGPKRGRMALQDAAFGASSSTAIFDGLTFFVSGSTKNEPVKRHELELLLRVGDGRVFPLERISDKANDNENCFLLIRNSTELVPDIVLKLVIEQKLNILRMQWVYDSIFNFQRMNHQDYVIQEIASDSQKNGPSPGRGMLSRRKSKRGSYEISIR